VLELYGRPNTCKTQMCLRVAAEFCQFRDDRMCVVYFDLKNDFRAGRFLEVCEGNAEVGVTQRRVSRIC
jgi:hypothetical protein